jgi:putative redox protein
LIESKVVWTDNDRFIGQALSGHAMVVDTGKEKTANSPPELVLIALCGCTGADVVSILRKKREPFTSVEVIAKGERSPTPPTVFTEIKVLYRIGGKVTHKAVEDAVHLSETKYCSVSAMLAKTAKITYEIEYVG